MKLTSLDSTSFSKEIVKINNNKLNIILTDKNWEFFSFSKPGETKTFILDFWKKTAKSKTQTSILRDEVEFKSSAGEKQKKIRKINKKKKIKFSKKKNDQNNIKDLDFRYGSVFIWPNLANSKSGYRF